MKHIRIEITEDELAHMRHAEVLRDIHIVNRLRAAGIPVVGPLSIRGVERGRLTMSMDDIFGSHVFEWEGPEAEELPDPFAMS